VGVIETKINGYLMDLVIGCPAIFYAPAAQISQPLTGKQLDETRFNQVDHGSSALLLLFRRLLKRN
jgi:hypothetical protein